MNLISFSLTRSLAIVVAILITTGTFATAAPKQAEKTPSKKDDVPYMMPGLVMAGRVWVPDEDGYFHMPGKLVGGKYRRSASYLDNRRGASYAPKDLEHQ